jgi:DNA polymerase-3 subunit alpha
MLEHGAKLIEDAVVCVKGRLDTREDAPKLVCLEVTCVELAAAGIVPLRLAVPPHRVDERCVEELKRMLVEHPGDSPVFLKLGTTELRLPPTFNVDTTNGLLGELRVLLGPACIQG